MKKMKKSMLAALLLAGVMSLGLTACGDKDGGEVTPGGGNGGGVVGQQVTADGWVAAFANTDPSNVYANGFYMEQEGSDKVEEVMEYIYTPNGFYLRDSYIETYHGQKVEMEAKWWQYQQDGVVYDYEIDVDEGEWEVGYDLEVYDEDDMFEMWSDITGEDIEDVLMNYSAFTYNAGKGVYRLDKTVDVRGVDTICWMEIMISNNKVYSIEYSIDYSFLDGDTDYKSTVNTKVVFAAKTITYPEQDALNALIASNSGNSGNGGADVNEEFILGTYKFYSMTVSGSTSSVENGMPEDYISVGINANHTMYYSIMNNEALVLDWEIVGDNLQCSTGGTLMMTFEIRGGELVMHSGSDIVVLVKKSSKVNPDDFNLGESGGGGIGGGDVGGGKDDGVIVAEYYLQSLELGGDLYEIGDLFYDDILTESYYKWTFYSDNTAVYTYAGSETENCVWNRQGSSVLVEGDNLGIMELMIDGDRLLMDNTNNRGALITFVGEGFSVGGGEDGGGKDDGESGDVDMTSPYGTYNFVSIWYGGDTYYVGESFYGRVLTEDFLVVALKEDGTAYVRSSGDNSMGRWEWQMDNIYVETGDNYYHSFSWNNGVLEATSSPLMTLGKTSDEVNPEYFGFSSDNGGESGDGNESEAEKIAEYFFESFTYGGVTYYVGDKMLGGGAVLTETYYKLNFFDDGSAIYVWAGSNVEYCTWVLDGNTVALCGTSQGDFVLTFEDSRLIMDLSGAVIRFVGSGFEAGNDGGLGERGAYVGTYQFYCMEMWRSNTYYVGDYFTNMNCLTAQYYYFELYSDGTAYVIWQDNDMGSNCLWDVEAGVITVTTSQGYAITTLKADGEYLVEEEKYSYKVYLEKAY